MYLFLICKIILFFFFVILSCVMSSQWKVGGTLLPAGHKYSILEHSRGQTEKENNHLSQRKSFSVKCYLKYATCIHEPHTERPMESLHQTCFFMRLALSRQASRDCAVPHEEVGFSTDAFFLSATL